MEQAGTDLDPVDHPRTRPVDLWALVALLQEQGVGPEPPLQIDRQQGGVVVQGGGGAAVAQLLGDQRRLGGGLPLERRLVAATISLMNV